MLWHLRWGMVKAKFVSWVFEAQQWQRAKHSRTWGIITALHLTSGTSDAISSVRVSGIEVQSLADAEEPAPKVDLGLGIARGHPSTPKIAKLKDSQLLQAFGNTPHLFFSPTGGNTGSCRLHWMFSCTKYIGNKEDLTQAGSAINARLVTSQLPPCFHVLPGCVREGYPWKLAQEQQLRSRSTPVYLWLQLQRGRSAQLRCRCGSSFPVVFSQPSKCCSSRTSWFPGGITGSFFCEFIVIFWDDTSF